LILITSLCISLGVKLSDDNLATVIAAAALMRSTEAAAGGAFKNQSQFYHGSNEEETFVVTVNANKYNVSFGWNENDEYIVCGILKRCHC
jgi:hypothetical protein